MCGAMVRMILGGIPDPDDPNAGIFELSSEGGCGDCNCADCGGDALTGDGT
jgi:hypothetical protein